MMFHRFRSSAWCLRLVAPLVLAVIGGCGGPYAKLARVSGKVTLGGQPLADAFVQFSPAAGGSQSVGKTDGNGNYTLVFTRGVNGAEVGEHNVTISTYVDPVPDADPPQPGAPEKVPLKYRSAGELKATVKKGSNPIDFALEPGPIEEPKPEKGKGGKKKIVTGCF